MSGTNTGFITSKAMVPIIVLIVLWKNTDQDNPMSQDALVDAVLEIYEPPHPYKNKSQAKKMISKTIQEMNYLFEEAKNRLGIEVPISIGCGEMKKKDEGCNHQKGYYIKERLFSNEEIQLLADSVIYSKGIIKEQVGRILNKLSQLTNRQIVNPFKMIEYTDVVKRTGNGELFDNLRIIGEGIKEQRKVKFVYRDKEAPDIVSPYYMVMSNNNYYMICNRPGTTDLSFFRLDFMKNTALVENEYSKPRRDIDEFRGGNFNLATFMKQHNRMYFGNVIEAKLRVSNSKLDAVKNEYFIEDIHLVDDSHYEVKIISTPLGITNWVVNMGDEVVVLEQDGTVDLRELLYDKAKMLQRMYGSRSLANDL